MKLFRAREPNYILVASSFLFAVPSLVAYTHGQYLTSQLCSLLLISSIQYHGQPSLLSFLMDQLAICLLILQGIMDAYRIGLTGFIVLGIVNGYSAFIYYGPWSHYFVYHPNIYISSAWHGTIHIMVAGSFTIEQLFLL